MIAKSRALAAGQYANGWNLSRTGGGHDTRAATRHRLTYTVVVVEAGDRKAGPQRPGSGRPHDPSSRDSELVLVACRLCQAADAEPVCSKTGVWSGRSFDVCRCPNCRFVFIGNPWLEYDAIYNEDYYKGAGADPTVDYVGEITSFARSIRRYEWRGIHDRIASITDLAPDTAWLDYGCGAGGLVRYLNGSGSCEAVGFEQGWAVPRLRSLGIPILDEAALEASDQAFDVVTAIEVIEHVLDPIAELRRLRRVLKPGGLLFMTTGNPCPFWNRLDEWSYILPEVHISFFAPNTLAWALEQAGFAPLFPGYGPGWTDILRFKILKNLGRRRTSPIESAVPWPIVSRLADRRFAISSQPLGRAI